MPKDYSRITLLVDMDDTIENLLPAWAEWLNKKRGTSIKADDITGWDVQKFFPSLTKDEVGKIVVTDHYAIAAVPRAKAGKILALLADKKIKNTRVKVSLLK